MCPHGKNSTPTSCSQCIGAAARLVRSDERGVTVDGVQVRAGILDTGIVSAPRHDRTRTPPVLVRTVAAPRDEPDPAPRLITDPMPMTPEQIADLVARVRAAEEAAAKAKDEVHATIEPRPKGKVGGARPGSGPKAQEWYVIARAMVDGERRRRAIGPIAWSRARELAIAWEREHGSGTAAVVETPGMAKMVNA